MVNARKKNRSRVKSSDGTVSVIKNCFIGMCIAIAVGFILLLIMSALALSFEDPDMSVGGMALAALYISALVGGFASVRMNSGEALLCGALVGAMLNVALVVISLFFRGGDPEGFGVGELLTRGAVILMSVLGAYMGLHKKKRKRRR